MMIDARASAWMRHALALAAEALLEGEAPIGALVVLGDGRVAGSGYNRMQGTGDVTRHAEIVALSASAGQFAPGARGLTLVSTLEPCVMCTGAAMEAGIEHIVYGLPAPADSGSGRVRPPESPDATVPTIQGGVMARHSRDLFLAWLDQHAADASREGQRAFIQQLLSLTMTG
jgi:tRNA(Arg) A34 adenosine deaminase TadA